MNIKYKCSSCKEINNINIDSMRAGLDGMGSGGVLSEGNYFEGLMSSSGMMGNRGMSIPKRISHNCKHCGKANIISI